MKFLPSVRDLTCEGHSIVFFYFCCWCALWSKCFSWTTYLLLLVLLRHYHFELTSKKRNFKCITKSCCVKGQTKADTASCLAWSIKYSYVQWRVTQIIFFKGSQLGAHYFLVYLLQLIYMFRAIMCPSSAELTVCIGYWCFSDSMGGCLVCADQSATHTEWKIPVSHRSSKFCWWWEHNCPKHVQKLK